MFVYLNIIPIYVLKLKVRFALLMLISVVYYFVLYYLFPCDDLKGSLINVLCTALVPYLVPHTQASLRKSRLFNTMLGKSVRRTIRVFMI